MPISVNRGDSYSSNGYRPPVAEPAVEAESESEEMYAEYSEPEERPDLETPVQEEGNSKVLRSLIPDTEEDFEFGFRILRDHEYQSLLIPKDRNLYSTREDASKNIFKISAARLGEHLKELMAFKFPANYLWDSKGMTPECIAELKIKISYTARKVFPTEDWKKYKRGQLGKVGVENPKYPLRFKYWEEVAKRSQEYQSWLESWQAENPEEEPEIYQGEWVFTENPEEREERHSKARSQIELSRLGFIQQLKDYFSDIREEAIKIAVDEAITTRLEIDKRHAQMIANPEELEEDEDL